MVDQAATPFYQPLNTTALSDKPLSRILVLSDLHLSAGKSPATLLWDRLENFTADADLEALLTEKRIAAQTRNTRVLLVINGDFIDFLRITRTPDESDLRRWRDELDWVASEPDSPVRDGVLDDFDAFAGKWRQYVLDGKRLRLTKEENGIRSEERFGLKTQDYKSVFRLLLTMEGHPRLFRSLTEWMGAGHPLMILTGNHDPEFDQDLVQIYLRRKLEQLATSLEANVTNFSSLLHFYSHGIELDETIRIEHGHRYEWYTATEEEWLDQRTQEIMLPAGSLFNRYLLNQMETVVPYLDNVKPSTRVITFLLMKHRVQFLGILGQLMETVWRLFRKKGARRLILQGFFTLATSLIPLIYVLWLGFSLDWQSGSLLIQLWESITWLGVRMPRIVSIVPTGIAWLACFLIQSKLTSHFELDTLIANMSSGFGNQETPEQYHAIIGHTHQPTIQQWNQQGIRYHNSGTWTPVFQYESGVVQDDLTRTYVDLQKTENNGWQAELKRWIPHVNTEAEVILTEEHTE